MFRSILQIFFPSTCLSCGKSITEDDQMFCATCAIQIAMTDFDNPAENEMARRLAPIRNLQYAVAPFYYKADSPIQQLLFKIKYQDRSDLAKKIGVFFAGYIQEKLSDKAIDIITCVPLHRDKLKLRGYNQSEILASAISELNGIPFLNCLKRLRLTETQTHFGRMARLENQSDSIQCTEEIKNYGHVLLVDDVLTTGATVETCCDALRGKNPTIAISIATLCMADHW